MASSPAAAPAQPTYRDDVSYEVAFAKVVRRKAFKYLPRDRPVMTGAALKEIIAEYGADAVLSAEPR